MTYTDWDKFLTYEFEDWCHDNNIDERSIDDSTHQLFIDSYYNYVQHKTYVKQPDHLYESILNSYDTNKLMKEIHKRFIPKYFFMFTNAYKPNVSKKSIVLKYKDISFKDDKEFISLLNLYNYFITYIDEDNRLVHIEPNIPDDKLYI